MKAMVLALTAAFAMATTACDVGATEDDVTATIALDMTAPRPTAQLVIGDAAPVTAIFDTGAAASVLRLSYAERIGAPRQGQAAAHAPSGTPVQGFRTTIENARLGEARFDSAMAVALDIALPLEGVDAIISPSVFSGRLVRFDFSAGVAQVLPRSAQNTPGGAAQAYVGENMHGRFTRIPGVRVELPGAEPIIAVTDTGSSGGILLPLALAQSVRLSGPLVVAERLRMVGAEHASFTARVDGEVRVGPLVLQNPEVRFVDGVTQSLVGMDVLRNTVLTLDPAGQRSWLAANPVR